MPIIDQSEIDQLLAEADGLAAEATEQLDQPQAASAATPAPKALQISDPRVKRLLKIRVPVIVQLAQSTMSVAIARGLSVGAIIEFNKSVEEQLDLLINNRPIGRGNCVKAGEYFGLRITQICDKAHRLQSMGPS